MGCEGVSEGVEADMAYTCSFGCPVQSMCDVIKPISVVVIKDIVAIDVSGVFF